jgi:pilus assembly protein Flp/PilA
MLATLKSMVRDDEGAAMVEYGLLIGFIALVAMHAVKVVGTDLSSVLNTVASHV